MTHDVDAGRRRALAALGFGACGIGGLSLLALPGCAERSIATTGGPIRLDLLGSTDVPGHLDIDGTRVGGLSGLDYDAARDRWWIVSDDRSEFAPARLYLARIAWTGRALDVEIERAVILKTPEGVPYAQETIDPESVRLGPDGLLWVTSEGIRHRHTGPPPFVRAHTPDGRYVRELILPPQYRVERGHGPRSNAVFEGLAFEPDGRGLWVSTEGPLFQDAPEATTAHGAPLRFTRFDLVSGRPTAQFVYPIDPIPHSPMLLLPGRRPIADTGVSEILMLDASTLLVLERSYTLGSGATIRVYAVRLDRSATDVLGLDSLVGSTWTPLTKTLILDSDALPVRVDNLEGMAFGPKLPNGERLFVMCADDNFNPLQRNQFIAFSAAPRELKAAAKT